MIKAIPFVALLMSSAAFGASSSAVSSPVGNVYQSTSQSLLSSDAPLSHATVGTHADSCPVTTFELIGLHARINSIESFKASGRISDPGTLIKLDQILITDQIEEAGVLARINAYAREFKQAKNLYDTIDSYYSIDVQKRGWEERSVKAQKEKSVREKILANPPAYTQPVEVHENKVMIWQVK